MLAGFPCVDFLATLVGGSYHEKDSSTVAFELAAGAAFREAFGKAEPLFGRGFYTMQFDHYGSRPGRDGYGEVINL